MTNGPRRLTRRQAMQSAAAVLGGVALCGGERLLAFSFDDGTREQAMAAGVGDFSAADVALLDEIADTILPETSTPGAKAAKTGAFMALMVNDAYSPADQQVFREGLRKVDAACRAAHQTPFMQASPAQRLAVVELLDREQQTAMAERANPPRLRAPAAVPPPEQPAHYFRMMKELALLGYFTSEIGCTQALRYVESPGRYEPDTPHAPGDRSWAPHA